MNQLLTDLEYAISLKRPHAGNGVHRLCSYIVDRIGNKYQFVDFCGNIHVDLRLDPRHQTLFTAHVDTVHREDGPNKFKREGAFLYADGSVLGADDGAGVALLLHLIDNKIPAYYIFFQGEERGGIGSKYLADNDYEMLYDFQRAIAFDRKATFSVITSQIGVQCASDVFAQALSDKLNEVESEFLYAPDDTGIYTDTAEFMSYIPECTNLSVGYYNEHTPNEKLNLDHFYKLAKAIINIDFDSLPVVRDPSVITPIYTDYSYPSYTEYYNTNQKPIKLTERELAQLETEEDQVLVLIDALERAMEGRFNELIRLVSEYTYPEDPSVVSASIRTKYLTMEVLTQLLDMADRGTPIDAVYETLFDYATTGELFSDKY